MRIWTSKKGNYTQEAKFVSYLNGTVTIERADGIRGKVHVDELSEEDRTYVDKWMKEVKVKRRKLAGLKSK